MSVFVLKYTDHAIVSGHIAAGNGSFCSLHCPVQIAGNHLIKGYLFQNGANTLSLSDTLLRQVYRDQPVKHFLTLVSL